MVVENKPNLMATKIEQQQLDSVKIENNFDQLNTKTLENFSQNEIQIEKETKKHISYRPDIDGLRTIAVSIVVIFHACPDLMPGGFIGVDIFFVISGFLISSIIIEQTLKGKFSYIDFYTRRIKRIYPALIVVLIFVLIMSIKNMEPRPLELVTQTMTFSTLFAANINILFAQHDYFDPESTTNPILHLWSLGVEQQFYIFWPLLINIILNRFPNKALYFLSTFTVLSFILNIFAVYKDTQFAFYFPFCRFWQMSVGGLIAYLNLKVQNKTIINVLSIVSMIAIFSTVWVVNQYSLFPGFWALVPTLGAAGIIQAGNGSLLNKYVLSSKLFIFVGKISYSLYLWHWPLLVFSRLLYPEGSKSIFAKSEWIVSIAIALSIISYFLIENPIRFRKEKIVPLLLFLIMIGIGFEALWVKNHAKEFSSSIIIEFDQEDDDIPYHPSLEEQEQDQVQQINLILPQEDKAKEKEDPKQDPSHQDKAKEKEDPKQDPSHEDKAKEKEDPKQNPSHEDKKEKVKKQHRPLSQKQQQFIREWTPLQQDYITVNGRRIPNSSKNPYREPPTIAKIKSIHPQRAVPRQQRLSKVLLSTRIKEGSKYYRPGQQILHHYEVSNEGKNKQLFIIGDSHGRFSLQRFQKLYNDAKQEDRLQGFPTIVSLIKEGSAFVPEDPAYNFSMSMINEFKPDRIIFIYRWTLNFRCVDQKTCRDPFETKYYEESMRKFEQILKQLIGKGIQIYVTAINPEGNNYSPLKMLDANGIIEENIKPIRLGQFRNSFAKFIQIFDSIVKNTGVKVIDFTDHMCYNDICQVFTPNGYPIHMDQNHQNKPYSTYWAGTLDIVTEF